MMPVLLSMYRIVGYILSNRHTFLGEGNDLYCKLYVRV